MSYTRNLIGTIDRCTNKQGDSQLYSEYWCILKRQSP